MLRLVILQATVRRLVPIVAAAIVLAACGT
jgi:hypothetical protein